MSLDYRFGSYGQGDDTFWADRVAALNDADKEFFHNGLPFMLMGVDIGQVNLVTIPHIVSRVMMFQPAYAESIEKFLTQDGFEWDGDEPKGTEAKFEKYLERFIGFSTNVCTETTTKFMQTKMKHKPKLTSKDVQYGGKACYNPEKLREEAEATSIKTAEAV